MDPEDHPPRGTPRSSGRPHLGFPRPPLLVLSHLCPCLSDPVFKCPFDAVSILNSLTAMQSSYFCPCGLPHSHGPEFSCLSRTCPPAPTKRPTAAWPQPRPPAKPWAQCSATWPAMNGPLPCVWIAKGDGLIWMCCGFGDFKDTLYPGNDLYFWLDSVLF